jgi:hypothetical protein
MAAISATDDKTGRKFHLDDPDDLRPGEKLVFLLSLHGGGSVGAWQRAYFPAADFKENTAWSSPPPQRPPGSRPGAGWAKQTTSTCATSWMR